MTCFHHSFQRVIYSWFDFGVSYESVGREVFINIVMEFGITMNPERLIYMCLKESYSKIWIGIYLSDTLPIQNGLK